MKKIARKIFKIILFIVGLIFIFVALFMLDISSIRRSIDENQILYDQIVRDSSYVQDYYLKNNKYPDYLNKEFDQFKFIPKEKFSIYSDEFKESSFSPIDSDQYVLSRWNNDRFTGMWKEYYAYPSGKTSLALRVIDFYTLFFNPIVFIVISIFCFYIVFHKFKSRQNNSNKCTLRTL